MDPTPDQPEPQRAVPPPTPDAEPPGPEAAQSADAEHWNPLRTERARWSWGLMALFSAIYFVVAILTSAEFADLAATDVLGLPLGFLLGIAMIIAGLVITRFYLMKIEG